MILCVRHELRHEAPVEEGSFPFILNHSGRPQNVLTFTQQVTDCYGPTPVYTRAVDKDSSLLTTLIDESVSFDEMVSDVTRLAVHRRKFLIAVDHWISSPEGVTILTLAPNGRNSRTVQNIPDSQTL